MKTLFVLFPCESAGPNIGHHNPHSKKSYLQMSPELQNKYVTRGISLGLHNMKLQIIFILMLISQ